MTTNLMQASREWSTRPDEERFTSLTAMQDHFHALDARSKGLVLSSRKLQAAPVQEDPKGLVLLGPGGSPAAMTHWSFGQVAQRAGAPAGYLRDLPAPLAADCLNHGLMTRQVEDLGVYLRKDEDAVRLVACTGPNYGRVRNSEVVDALVKRFGDGITGTFRVPGEFGKAVEVTKANTTLFAGDRDCFVFLADEKNRITLPNRRAGMHGDFARGFFVWNSEVGSQTLGIAAFLFDYTCCNRIVWGVENFAEVRIRHTSSAPDRFLEEVVPTIRRFSEANSGNVLRALEAARNSRIGTKEDREERVEAFLSKRFTKSQVAAIANAHLADEGRPIESVWDAVTGVTAYARTIPFQAERVDVEREAGKMLLSI